ncbi:MAG: DUF4160 domain-containing protein [Gemmatimonadaceae bacterium]
MPTVLRVNGFVVRIYHPPREHGPAHVHVLRDGAEVVIELADTNRLQRIRDVLGMRDSDVLAAFRLVSAHTDDLLVHWRQLHG